jgi:hypothetical protein
MTEENSFQFGKFFRFGESRINILSVYSFSLLKKFKQAEDNFKQKWILILSEFELARLVLQ